MGCTGEFEGSGAILYDLSRWVHGTVRGIKHGSKPTGRQHQEGSLLSTSANSNVSGLLHQLEQVCQLRQASARGAAAPEAGS